MSDPLDNLHTHDPAPPEAVEALAAAVGGKTELGRRLLVSYRTVQKWCTGARKATGPTLAAMRLLADTLD